MLGMARPSLYPLSPAQSSHPGEFSCLEKGSWTVGAFSALKEAQGKPEREDAEEAVMGEEALSGPLSAACPVRPPPPAPLNPEEPLSPRGEAEQKSSSSSDKWRNHCPEKCCDLPKVTQQGVG